MSNTPHLDIAMVFSHQAQKEITVNAALMRLDALQNTGAISRAVNTPPSSPSYGDVYIIGSSPTGEWTGKALKIAYYDSAWSYITPQEGVHLWVNDENVLYSYTGVEWTAAQNITGGNLQQIALAGVNTTADSTNRLAVSSEAVLFTHEGDDCFMKINKASSGDTACFMLQSGYTTHAQFGLVGDNTPQLKVSADGSSFTQVFTVDNATGNVDFKQNVHITGSLSGALFATPGLYTAQQNTATYALTDGASIAWNLDNAQVAKVTLGGNRTLANPTHMVDGGTYILRVTQDATGSRTLGYSSAYKWPGGVAPVLSTAAGAVDILRFTSDGTYMYGMAQLAFA